MLVHIHGVPTNDYVKHFMGKGKYYDWGTNMGLCIPMACQQTYVEEVLRPVYTHIAENNGLENVTVYFSFESNILAAKFSFSSLNGMAYIPIFVVGFVFLIGALGLIIEFTQIGNRRDVALMQTIKTYDYAVWNRMLLLVKEKWALFFLAFSPARNTFYVLTGRRKKREYKKPTAKS